MKFYEVWISGCIFQSFFSFLSFSRTCFTKLKIFTNLTSLFQKNCLFNLFVGGLFSPSDVFRWRTSSSVWLWLVFQCRMIWPVAGWIKPTKSVVLSPVYHLRLRCASSNPPPKNYVSLTTTTDSNASASGTSYPASTSILLTRLPRPAQPS